MDHVLTLFCELQWWMIFFNKNDLLLIKEKEDYGENVRKITYTKFFRMQGKDSM